MRLRNGETGGSRPHESARRDLGAAEVIEPSRRVMVICGLREEQRVMRLLLGSLLLRPYVFIFLLIFLVAGVRDLGTRRTALFLAWVLAARIRRELRLHPDWDPLRALPLHGDHPRRGALHRGRPVLRFPVVHLPRLCIALSRPRDIEFARMVELADSRAYARPLSRRGSGFRRRDDAARRRDRSARGPGRPLVSRAGLLVHLRRGVLRRAALELRGMGGHGRRQRRRLPPAGGENRHWPHAVGGRRAILRRTRVQSCADRVDSGVAIAGLRVSRFTSLS